MGIRASKAQLEKQLTGQIDRFRVALEGSKPELAAQLSAMDEQMAADKQAMTQAEETIASLETELVHIEADVAGWSIS